MSWDCCTPIGTCQRGHGCPAGGCNQDCNQGRACPARQLRRVQLDGSATHGRKASRSALAHVAKRVTQLVAVFAVVAIWAAACVATDGNDSPLKHTHMEVA